jgi:hypothetical protein
MTTSQNQPRNMSADQPIVWLSSVSVPAPEVTRMVCGTPPTTFVSTAGAIGRVDVAFALTCLVFFMSPLYSS